MDAADVDNSGTIDHGEFIAAKVHLKKLKRESSLILIRMGAASISLLVAAFAYFDKVGSGWYITVDEVQQACKEHNISDIFLNDFIKEVDQDDDGGMDHGEFLAMGFGIRLGRQTMQNNLNVKHDWAGKANYAKQLECKA